MFINCNQKEKDELVLTIVVLKRDVALVDVMPNERSVFEVLRAVTVVTWSVVVLVVTFITTVASYAN